VAIFNEYTALAAYQDLSVNTNPQERFVDWRKNVVNVSVDNPLNQKFQIVPSGTQMVFSGTRTTTIDNTTAFSIAINPTNSNLYRVTATGGTAPGFRTNRGLALNGDTVTVTVNNNVSVIFNILTSNWSAVQVGDVVFVPTGLTGDASSPFNVLNGGFWVIIGKDAGGTPKNMTATRLPGQSFSGTSETVVQTSNSQFQAFSSSGIQVGDTLQISSGFSLVTQQLSYSIATVTATFVEFLSSTPLPLETNISPGNSGMTFYNAAKRFVRIEVDQACYVQFNGSSDTTNILLPRAVGDIRNGFAWLEKWGLHFSVNIVNKSPNNILNVVFISAQ
jgi:hypothetical protein